MRRGCTIVLVPASGYLNASFCISYKRTSRAAVLTIDEPPRIHNNSAVIPNGPEINEIDCQANRRGLTKIEVCTGIKQQLK